MRAQVGKPRQERLERDPVFSRGASGAPRQRVGAEPKGELAADQVLAVGVEAIPVTKASGVPACRAPVDQHGGPGRDRLAGDLDVPG